MAIGEIKKLAGALVRHIGEEEGETIRRSFVWLSVLVMKGNAAILLNCILTPPHRHIEEGEV